VIAALHVVAREFQRARLAVDPASRITDDDAPSIEGGDDLSMIEAGGEAVGGGVGVGADQVGAEQVGADQVGAEQVGAEQVGDSGGMPGAPTPTADTWGPVAARSRGEALKGAGQSAAAWGAKVLHGGIHPRSPEWAGLSPEARTQWWVRQLAPALAIAAGAPSAGGRVAHALPFKDLVGFTGQVVMVCAVCHEYDVHDLDAQVSIIAAELLQRGWSVADVRAARSSVQGMDWLQKSTYLLAGDSSGLRGKARLVWRLAKVAAPIEQVVAHRIRGGGLIGRAQDLPGVGAVFGVANELKALRTVAKAAADGARRHGPAAGSPLTTPAFSPHVTEAAAVAKDAATHAKDLLSSRVTSWRTKGQSTP